MKPSIVSAVRTGRRGPHVVAAALAVCAWLFAAAPAPAASTLSYPAASGPMTVTAGDPAVAISISQTIATSCTLCNTFISAQSPQLLTTPDTARCTDVVGDGSLWQCRPLPSSVSITGSPGADTLSAGGTGAVPCASPSVALAGAGGADELRSGCGTDRLDGGDGRDTLDGGAGADVLEGGAEGDALYGQSGSDALRGADGRDLLVPGTGADAITGGPGIDTVSYEERGGPLTVSLGGGADDGEPGEGDTVGDDVENVVGGAAGDTLVGSASTNDVDAGAGNDVIDAAGGADVVDAGPGDDVVRARDGVPDRIVCGDGADQATIDAFDTVEGCETVDASRALMPDVDNDGIVAPADCNDNDAAVRPGLPDRPGDGKDGDCAGGDADFPRVLSSFELAFDRGAGAKYIRYTKLDIIDVPDGATVELTCRGRGCFRGARRTTRPTGAARVALARHLRRRKLRPGSIVEVRVTRPDTTGKVFRFRTLTGKRNPKATILCRRPGSKAPHSCAKA